MWACEIVVEVARAQNSHISSHLLPLGQVKGLLHISVVNTVPTVQLRCEKFDEQQQARSEKGED